MALRIRVPWGLLLSALAFAALAAGAGYLFLTDYHGQLWRRCGLHAIGAAMLGACAWRYSERLTDFVNLHTAPLMRLALPGVVSIWLATELAGVFSELTVGMRPWWAPLLVPLAFAAAGIVPLLAGVALIAGIETALAARRGGASVLDSVRPIVPHLLAGVALAAAAGYVAVAMPHVALRQAVALAPDGTRGSGWMERERRLFAEVNEGWNCQVLVVPFQAGEPSIDRIARSMMTRLVAAELAERSGLCVADPTLVARALGTQARAYRSRAVQSLADRMGAVWLVRGDIRMEAERPALNVAVRVARRHGAQDPWSSSEETVWGPIVFSDELPPEAAFARLAREAAAGIGIVLQDVDPLAADTADAVQLPSAMDLLAAEAPSAVVRARGLQLLALAHHPADVAGEHLWERSLIALRHLPARDERARVLRARAALHLHRRPHAMALLEGLTGAEARAVSALGDGNLIEAEALAPLLSDAAAALMAEMELERLRARYGRSGAQRREALLDAWPGYAALLYAPLSGTAPVETDVHERIAEQLAALGLRVAPGPMDAIAVRLGAALAGRGSLAADLERGRAAVWRAHGANWRAARAFDRVAVWDVADALHGANRHAVVTQARSLQLPDPDGLVAFAEALGPAFSGYPPLAGTVAVALQAAAADGDALAVERARRLPGDVLAWEGGESDTERELRARVAALPVAPADEPPRAWRPLPAAPAPSAAALQEEALHYAGIEAYAQSDFAPLERAIQRYDALGERERVLDLEAQARRRFIGSPARERFLLERADAARDLAAIVTVLHERVRQAPRQWQTYPALAHAYLRAQEPVLAQRALLAYPGFDAPAGEATLSAAAEAGALLMAAGEGELARPLLMHAARTSVDSAARVRSRMALAQIDGDWAQAQALALELHERYEEDGALARAATLAFLRGEAQAGWRGFYEAAKRFENTGPWAAAVAGHRIEATAPADAVAFAKRWKSLSGARDLETRLRAHFLFNLLMVDRPASDSAIAAMNEIAAQDAGMRTIAASYAAFKRGDYAKVLAQLGLGQESAERASVPDPLFAGANGVALPWAVLALAQGGRAAEAQPLLQAAGKSGTRDFHVMLGAAYLTGSLGQVERALAHLFDAALLARAHAGALVPPGFQVLEAAERLHTLTGDDRFRLLLLDLARRQQRAWPVSWAYAFEARYAAQAEAADHALGAALFLDQQSEQLRDFPKERRQRAAERYARLDPFRAQMTRQ